ncbi:MAG TPA: YbaB/EbfC family nucleoid-associated protein [Verrucomicrobiae bacterium]|jgi:DNA-binding YbaB/EbfC family protein|nr:YbaB/EbfC family nucleoid-associated protein [Verrucomicrobiae bacterium]
MNQAQLMAQVKKMQSEMARAQEELADTVVTGSAAGGSVTVEMTCDQRVKSVKIVKEAVDPDDIETLEDLVVVAVNDAMTKAGDASQKRMGSVTGGMRIPGLM